MKAFKLVENQLRKLESSDGKFGIDESNTQEHEWGWVVYYNSERFLQTHDVQFALMGNAPFLVNKETGKVASVSSSEQVESHIDAWINNDIE